MRQKKKSSKAEKNQVKLKNSSKAEKYHSIKTQECGWPWHKNCLSTCLTSVCHSLPFLYLSSLLSYPIISTFCFLSNIFYPPTIISFYFILFLLNFLSLSFCYQAISELEMLIICRMRGRQKWPNRFLNLFKDSSQTGKKFYGDNLND